MRAQVAQLRPSAPAAPPLPSSEPYGALSAPWRSRAQGIRRSRAWSCSGLPRRSQTRRRPRSAARSAGGHRARGGCQVRDVRWHGSGGRRAGLSHRRPSVRAPPACGAALSYTAHHGYAPDCARDRLPDGAASGRARALAPLDSPPPLRTHVPDEGCAAGSAAHPRRSERSGHAVEHLPDHLQVRLHAHRATAGVIHREPETPADSPIRLPRSLVARLRGGSPVMSG